MITIKGSPETRIIIKKSKFLGIACRIDNEQDAQRVLEKRKKQHYDARHHCFAYVLENGVMRYSDDGEPQGTAGLPMLEVIKKSGFSDVLIISTRYFGGTLLGTGGLVRAYTRSAVETLEAAQKVELVPCNIFSCTFSYNAWAKAEKQLLDAGYLLDDVQYSSDVYAKICVIDGHEDAFNHHITNLSLGQITPIHIGQKQTEHLL